MQQVMYTRLTRDAMAHMDFLSVTLLLFRDTGSLRVEESPQLVEPLRSAAGCGHAQFSQEVGSFRKCEKRVDKRRGHSTLYMYFILWTAKPLC